MPDIENNADEIDLLELIQRLWDGKWLIGGISAAALTIGGAYVALTPNKFDASIVIRPLDAAAFERFRPINDAILVARDTAGPTTPYLSSPSLLAEFTEVLLQRKTIAQAAGDSEGMIGGDFQGGSSLDAALIEFAFGVDVKPIEIPFPSISGTSNTATAWRLTWQASDEDVSDAFISDALRMTNDAARERLLQRISGEAEQIQRTNARSAAQLEQEIENAIEDYRVQVSDSLAYLSEQASLARVLGIEYGKGTGTGTGTGTTNFNTNSRSSALNVSSGMTYLTGYRALEEQISVLSSREQFEAFVPGLRDLQSELRSVEQDTGADELLAAVEATPLSSASEFQAAQYDLASIEVTQQKNISLILALSLVLGGFLGAVTVLLRAAVKARKSSSD
ncbi:Wzz/FepE/Etk N-terminal domain-containing protein [Roseobacter sp. HKCCD5988]|uniref:Wzz/FepE/Etk N-terminal domain-containing protein n=1 Tax=Roseobacter sp. HKCCD5988 TaxID=3120338 RepID=UPI0030ED62B0